MAFLAPIHGCSPAAADAVGPQNTAVDRLTHFCIVQINSNQSQFSGEAIGRFSPPSYFVFSWRVCGECVKSAVCKMQMHRMFSMRHFFASGNFLRDSNVHDEINCAQLG